LFSSRAFKKNAQILKALAGIGVAYSRREQAEAESQHDDVQHEMLLCVAISGARGMAFSPLLDGEVPPAA
jgi:hypothetical protein